MIVDSSVLVAILRDEPEADAFLLHIVSAPIARLSAASYLEAAVVLDNRRDAAASAKFDPMLQRLAIAIEPVTEVQARIARQAYRDFGKGSGHAAKLNFGDCLSYALAKDKGEPLLFKGRDFPLTDIEPAV